MKPKPTTDEIRRKAKALIRDIARINKLLADSGLDIPGVSDQGVKALLYDLDKEEEI